MRARARVRLRLRLRVRARVRVRADGAINAMILAAWFGVFSGLSPKVGGGVLWREPAPVVHDQ